MNREDAKLLPLAAVGIGKGLLEVYVAPVIQDTRPSTKAWGIILGAALCYDVYAANKLDGETLSDRYLDFQREHPVLALGALAITVGHLTDTIRDDRDVFHLATNLFKP